MMMNMNNHSSSILLLNSNSHDDNTASSANKPTLAPIMVPYGWQRKFHKLDNFGENEATNPIVTKVYYVSPSGHILDTEKEVNTYLKQSLLCRCYLNYERDWFDFDPNNRQTVQMEKDDCDTSLCIDWANLFQSEFIYSQMILSHNYLQEQSVDSFVERFRILYRNHNTGIENDSYEDDDNNINNNNGDDLALMNDDDLVRHPRFIEWLQSFDHFSVIVLQDGHKMDLNFNLEQLVHLTYELKVAQKLPEDTDKMFEDIRDMDSMLGHNDPELLLKENREEQRPECDCLKSLEIVQKHYHSGNGGRNNDSRTPLTTKIEQQIPDFLKLIKPDGSELSSASSSSSDLSDDCSDSEILDFGSNQQQQNKIFYHQSNLVSFNKKKVSLKKSFLQKKPTNDKYMTSSQLFALLKPKFSPTTTSTTTNHLPTSQPLPQPQLQLQPQLQPQQQPQFTEIKYVTTKQVNRQPQPNLVPILSTNFLQSSNSNSNSIWNLPPQSSHHNQQQQQQVINIKSMSVLNNNINKQQQQQQFLLASHGQSSIGRNSNVAPTKLILNSNGTVCNVTPQQQHYSSFSSTQQQHPGSLQHHLLSPQPKPQSQPSATTITSSIPCNLFLNPSSSSSKRRLSSSSTTMVMVPPSTAANMATSIMKKNSSNVSSNIVHINQSLGASAATAASPSLSSMSILSSNQLPVKLTKKPVQRKNLNSKQSNSDLQQQSTSTIISSIPYNLFETGVVPPSSHSNVVNMASIGKSQFPAASSTIMPLSSIAYNYQPNASKFSTLLQSSTSSFSASASTAATSVPKSVPIVLPPPPPATPPSPSLISSSIPLNLLNSSASSSPISLKSLPVPIGLSNSVSPIRTTATTTAPSPITSPTIAPGVSNSSNSDSPMKLFVFVSNNSGQLVPTMVPLPGNNNTTQLQQSQSSCSGSRTTQSFTTTTVPPTTPTTAAAAIYQNSPTTISSATFSHSSVSNSSVASSPVPSSPVQFQINVPMEFLQNSIKNGSPNRVINFNVQQSPTTSINSANNNNSPNNNINNNSRTTPSMMNRLSLDTNSILAQMWAKRDLFKTTATTTATTTTTTATTETETVPNDIREVPAKTTDQNIEVSAEDNVPTMIQNSNNQQLNQPVVLNSPLNDTPTEQLETSKIEEDNVDGYHHDFVVNDSSQQMALNDDWSNVPISSDGDHGGDDYRGGVELNQSVSDPRNDECSTSLLISNEPEPQLNLEFEYGAEYPDEIATAAEEEEQQQKLNLNSFCENSQLVQQDDEGDEGGKQFQFEHHHHQEEEPSEIGTNSNQDNEITFEDTDLPSTTVQQQKPDNIEPTIDTLKNMDSSLREEEEEEDSQKDTILSHSIIMAQLNEPQDTQDMDNNNDDDNDNEDMMDTTGGLSSNEDFDCENYEDSGSMLQHDEHDEDGEEELSMLNYNEDEDDEESLDDIDEEEEELEDNYHHHEMMMTDSLSSSSSHQSLNDEHCDDDDEIVMDNLDQSGDDTATILSEPVTIISIDNEQLSMLEPNLAGLLVDDNQQLYVIAEDGDVVVPDDVPIVSVDEQPPGDPEQLEEGEVVNFEVDPSVEDVAEDLNKLQGNCSSSVDTTVTTTTTTRTSNERQSIDNPMQLLLQLTNGTGYEMDDNYSTTNSNVNNSSSNVLMIKSPSPIKNFPPRSIIVETSNRGDSALSSILEISKDYHDYDDEEEEEELPSNTAEQISYHDSSDDDENEETAMEEEPEDDEDRTSIKIATTPQSEDNVSTSLPSLIDDEEDDDEEEVEEEVEEEEVEEGGYSDIDNDVDNSQNDNQPIRSEILPTKDSSDDINDDLSHTSSTDDHQFAEASSEEEEDEDQEGEPKNTNSPLYVNVEQDKDDQDSNVQPGERSVGLFEDPEAETAAQRNSPIRVCNSPLISPPILSPTIFQHPADQLDPRNLFEDSGEELSISCSSLLLGQFASSSSLLDGDRDNCPLISPPQRMFNFYGQHDGNDHLDPASLFDDTPEEEDEEEDIDGCVDQDREEPEDQNVDSASAPNEDTPVDLFEDRSSSPQPAPSIVDNHHHHQSFHRIEQIRVADLSSSSDLNCLPEGNSGGDNSSYEYQHLLSPPLPISLPNSPVVVVVEVNCDQTVSSGHSQEQRKPMIDDYKSPLISPSFRMLCPQEEEEEDNEDEESSLPKTELLKLSHSLSTSPETIVNDDGDEDESGTENIMDINTESQSQSSSNKPESSVGSSKSSEKSSDDNCPNFNNKNFENQSTTDDDDEDDDEDVDESNVRFNMNNKKQKTLIENSNTDSNSMTDDDDGDGQDSEEDLPVMDDNDDNSTDNSTTLDELRSTERYFKRMKRLKLQLQFQGMPGVTESDDDMSAVRLSPPLPPQERIFTVGSIVWGQRGDVRFWPGKVVSPDEFKNCPNMEEFTTRDTGKMIVRWYGTQSYSLVSPENLNTLSEGLEAHHHAQKRYRSGKRVNTSITQAIEEAMQDVENNNHS